MRSMVIDGIRYFRISDLSDAIGLTNVYRQVRDYKKITISTETNGGKQYVGYASEDEILRVINASRKISKEEKSNILKSNGITSETTQSCLQSEFYSVIKDIPSSFCEWLKFEQEFVFRKYRFDFFCKGIMLVVEFDEIHHKTSALILEDLQRDSFLKSIGFTVIRVDSNHPYESIPLIIKTLASLLVKYYHEVLHDKS